MRITSDATASGWFESIALHRANRRFTINQGGAMPTHTVICTICHVDGREVPAATIAPQSTDEGRTIVLIPVCSGHAQTWWDGADWGPIPFHPLLPVAVGA